MEWLLGGNPGTADASTILPVQTLTESHLILTFKRDDEANNATTQTVQWSSNMSTWTDISIAANSSRVSIVTNGSAPDDITVTIPRVPGKMFARLKVVEK
jgi:hypothetical protein